MAQYFNIKAVSYRRPANRKDRHNWVEPIAQCTGKRWELAFYGTLNSQTTFLLNFLPISLTMASKRFQCQKRLLLKEESENYLKKICVCFHRNFFYFWKFRSIFEHKYTFSVTFNGFSIWRQFTTSFEFHKKFNYLYIF